MRIASCLSNIYGSYGVKSAQDTLKFAANDSADIVVPWKAFKTFSNYFLQQMVSKPIYQVSLGQVSALWNKHFSSFVLKAVEKRIKTSSFYTQRTPT